MLVPKPRGQVLARGLGRHSLAHRFRLSQLHQQSHQALLQGRAARGCHRRFGQRDLRTGFALGLGQTMCSQRALQARLIGTDLHIAHLAQLRKRRLQRSAVVCPVGAALGRQRRQLAQGHAQAAHGHARLVHVFGLAHASAQSLQVGHQLVQAIAQRRRLHGPASIARFRLLRGIATPIQGLGFHHRPGRRAKHQLLAALGLAACVQPQAVARHPVHGHRAQVGQLPADQLHLQLMHGQTGGLTVRLSRHDLSAVQRQLDLAVALLQALHHARDLGAVRRQQRCVADRPSQQLAHGRVGMPAPVGLRHGIALRGAQVHVVLQPHDGPTLQVDGLGRLHPAIALAPHAQRSLAGRQAAIGRVEVMRDQRHAVPVALLHGLLQRIALPRRQGKLEFNFHDAFHSSSMQRPPP